MQYVCVNPEKLDHKSRGIIYLLDKNTRSEYIYTALQLLAFVIEDGLTDDLGFRLSGRDRDLLERIRILEKKISIAKLRRELEDLSIDESEKKNYI